jgi:hypothetical protein
MRTRPLLTTILLGVAVAASAEVTTRNIVGEWVTDTASRGVANHFTFQADHSFRYSGGDAVGAGKWNLHEGKKLELIYYSDYERKVVSASSHRDWIIIESFSTGHMRANWLWGSGEWTKQR